MSRGFRRSATLSLIALAAAGLALSDSASARTYANPIVDYNNPDPGVIQAGRRYYMVATSRGIPGFRILKSATLGHWWKTRRFGLTVQPRWSDGLNPWAPEIHHIGGHYVNYHVMETNSRQLVIAADTAKSVYGPYTDIGHPLVEAAGVGVIDPNVYTDSRGRHYLYFKTDGNPQGRPTYIYVVRLNAAGTATVGRPRAVMRNDRRWEGAVVEAPWVIRRGRYLYMFYSGGWYYQPSCATGVARSRSPLGGFRKYPRPIVHSNRWWWGTGHPTVVRGPSGNDDIILAGFRPGPWNGTRVDLGARIRWVHGWPTVSGSSIGATFTP